MSKTNNLGFILSLIFLVIFNILFFVLIGTDNDVSVWMSYGFIHFAYFMLLLTLHLVRKGKSSAVFGFSLSATSSVYFAVELVVGVIFIAISLESFAVPLLVQLVLAGVYGAILLSHMIANEQTADAEEKRQAQIVYTKDASAKLKTLLYNVTNKDAKKKIERVYDAIYSSPVKSHPSLIQTEHRILQYISELENAVYTENNDNMLSLADSLLDVVNERNMKLKTLN